MIITDRSNQLKCRPFCQAQFYAKNWDVSLSQLKFYVIRKSSQFSFFFVIKKSCKSFLGNKTGEEIEDKLCGVIYHLLRNIHKPGAAQRISNYAETLSLFLDLQNGIKFNFAIVKKINESLKTVSVNQQKFRDGSTWKQGEAASIGIRTLCSHPSHWTRKVRKLWKASEGKR